MTTKKYLIFDFYEMFRRNRWRFLWICTWCLFEQPTWTSFWRECKIIQYRQAKSVKQSSDIRVSKFFINWFAKSWCYLLNIAKRYCINRIHIFLLPTCFPMEISVDLVDQGKIKFGVIWFCILLIFSSNVVIVLYQYLLICFVIPLILPNYCHNCDKKKECKGYVIFP